MPPRARDDFKRALSARSWTSDVSRVARLCTTHPSLHFQPPQASPRRNPTNKIARTSANHSKYFLQFLIVLIAKGNFCMRICLTHISRETRFSIPAAKLNTVMKLKTFVTKR